MADEKQDTASTVVDGTQPVAASAAETVEKGEAVAGPEAEAAEEPVLPPLTAHQFRQYNRLAEHMNYFHEHFRTTWTRLYTATTTGKRPNGMSLRQFIDEGLQLVRHLTAHHNIEETYVFPVLAKKMPEFKSSLPPGRKARGKAEKQQALLLRQHQLIHEGMDGFEAYLEACKAGEKDFEMSVMREKMDTWGTVLWEHLDLEVKTLGAENMRRYWSLEELRRIPM